MLCPDDLQHKICDFGTHVSNSLFFGASIIGDCEGCEDGEPLVLAVIWGGMTILGYVLGIKKDRKAVTLLIEQAGTSGEEPSSE